MTPPSTESEREPFRAQERRKQLRKGTLWHGEIRTPTGLLSCHVLNLSAHGAKLEVDGPLAAGQPVTLVMEPLGEFSGLVVWERNGQVGIRINEHRATRTEIVLPRSLATEQDCVGYVGLDP